MAPPDSASPPAVPATPAIEPYPALVRARVAAGWDPNEAATVPPSPRARLTAEEVEKLRASTAPAKVLAVQFRISVRHVKRIRRGWAWKGRTV